MNADLRVGAMASAPRISSNSSPHLKAEPPPQLRVVHTSELQQPRGTQFFFLNFISITRSSPVTKSAASKYSKELWRADQHLLSYFLLCETLTLGQTFSEVAPFSNSIRL